MRPIIVLRGLLLPLFALSVAACGDSEADCRAGVTDLNRRMNAMVNTELAGSVPAVREELNTARQRRDAGDYAGCTEAVERGRAAVRASQRTNQ